MERKTFKCIFLKILILAGKFLKKKIVSPEFDSGMSAVK